MKKPKIKPLKFPVRCFAYVRDGDNYVRQFTETIQPYFANEQRIEGVFLPLADYRLLRRKSK